MVAPRARPVDFLSSMRRGVSADVCKENNDVKTKEREKEKEKKKQQVNWCFTRREVQYKIWTFDYVLGHLSPCRCTSVVSRR